MALSFENKEKFKTKISQLILLLKVWIKPVDGFIPCAIGPLVF
jgi:hypothetical protein